ncbi:hypothetical protein KYK29_03605 [Shinella daejeonensis]|uniref:hypothetical protein n=1 Tax=Shinella daejeonensis TaxID=659017 RepID=UPI0020C82D6F|nr:hypothetical protein [Shinella daejeonensis]MCP8894002.1 hypothetical protein [Shinella daejeonensis]
MARVPGPPPLHGLRRQIERHRQMKAAGGGAFVRETFCMERQAAREKAREWFDQWPKAAYWTAVESWRALDGDRVEFTMRRLSSAD